MPAPGKVVVGEEATGTWCLGVLAVLFLWTVMKKISVITELELQYTTMIQ